MSEPKRIVFFGNEQLATGVAPGFSVLEALLDRGYTIVKIFSRPDSSGKHKKPGIEDIAAKHSIPLSDAIDMHSIAEELKNLSPDAGVLVAYGLVVTKGIIDIFPSGILNIHPSLLPKGRGPAPIEETILDGSKETGVSIMLLSEEMDKGPILAQKKIKLSGNDTKQHLADTLLHTGSRLLIDCLGAMFSRHKIEPVPQADRGVTYTSKLKKEDGLIDWNKPAEIIEREIRAYAGWPKSRARLGSMDCIITGVEISDMSGRPGEYVKDGRSLTVFAGAGSLNIRRLQPAGKREMSIDEFLRGYGQRL